MTIILVVGTGTEVGKTWATAALLRAARDRGNEVAARKPAQSFDVGDDERGVTDAQVLGAASGEDAHQVCPAHRWYPTPMAPPMAADALGRDRFTIADLAAELALPGEATDGRALAFVETAGGVRSPLAHDGDALALAAHVDPTAILVVADAGLGTINALVLTLAAVRHEPATADVPLVVLLNRYDAVSDLHQRNARWLATHEPAPCVTSVPEALDRLLAAL